MGINGFLILPWGSDLQGDDQAGVQRPGCESGLCHTETLDVK